MTVNKVVSSFAEAVADIFHGATVMVGGAQGPLGIPSNLLKALCEKGAKDLTIISAMTGIGIKAATRVGFPEWYVDYGILVENKQVKKIICCAPFLTLGGVKTATHDPYYSGELEVEHVPHGTMTARIWAAAAGVGGVYVPVGLGTLIEEGKEKRVIDGKEYLLELPLKADFALVAARKSDNYGNLVYWGTGRNYNPVMARAASITIAEVEEVVEPGELDPEVIVTPGIYVDRVLEIRREAGA